jgi:hypothetical protein
MPALLCTSARPADHGLVGWVGHATLRPTYEQWCSSSPEDGMHHITMQLIRMLREIPPYLLKALLAFRALLLVP